MPLSYRRSHKPAAAREGRDPFFKKEGSHEGYFFANAINHRNLPNPSSNLIQRQSDAEARQQAQSRISTPLPATATITRRQAATLTINGAQVTILPDRHTRNRRMRNRAKTDAHRRYSIPRQFDRQGQLTSFGQPIVTVTIQTTYGPGAVPSGDSEYGRGTTAADIRAGQTSLGFHEGRHGQNFLDYLSSNSLPVLNAHVGMTRAEFRQAEQDYAQAFHTYFEAMDQASLQQTDCVGITIDQALGTQECPTP